MTSLPAVSEDDLSSLDVDPDELAKELSPYLKPGKEQQGIQVVTTMIRKVHQGPLPDPETLGGYEHVLPGAAERIMQMAEREQGHRHKQEGRLVVGEYLTRLFGQLAAVFVIGLLVTLAALCAWLQQPIAAGVITAIGAAGVGFMRYPSFRRKLDKAEAEKPQQPSKKPRKRANQSR